MPALSIFCRLISWVVGSSSVSVSVSASVVFSRSCLDHWTCFLLASVPCLCFLVPWLWPAVFSVLVIHRVMLVCSGMLCFCQHAPGLAPVRPRFFNYARCHYFVTLSQCLTVCLSCRVTHCCRLALSSVVVVSVSSLADVVLVSCAVRVIAPLSMCRPGFVCGPHLGR